MSRNATVVIVNVFGCRMVSDCKDVGIGLSEPISWGLEYRWVSGLKEKRCLS